MDRFGEFRVWPQVGGKIVSEFLDRGAIAAFAQAEFPQHFPASGWVEHEPEDIWNSTVATCREAMKKANVGPKDIAAIGITNQRETALVWDRATGRAIHRAIQKRGHAIARRHHPHIVQPCRRRRKTQPHNQCDDRHHHNHLHQRDAAPAFVGRTPWSARDPPVAPACFIYSSNLECRH